MGKYLGLVGLDETLSFAALTRSGDTPLNAAAAPTFRVYGPDGLMVNGTGTTSFKDSGDVTGATDASPIEITSVGHGLSTGAHVTVTGVGGNTAANGTFTVTVTGADTFTLDGSTFSGTYTSGGTWNATGLYGGTVAATGANGYESGENYCIVYNGTVNSLVWADMDTFTVT